MKKAKDWVDALDMQPHPEGGYYKEVFRSLNEIAVDRESLIETRSVLTSIYFLLRSDDRSVFHRLKSEEIWYFHTGNTATIHIIHPDGKLESKLIGPDVLNGENLQVTIPGGTWFGAKLNSPESYILVSCAVAPGFDFADFEMPDRKNLLELFPQHESLIIELTKNAL